MTRDKNKDGGAAYPAIAVDGSIFDVLTKRVMNTGMTVRQYYKAHAPVEPWPEFKPKMEETPARHVVKNGNLNRRVDGPGPEWEREVAMQRRIQWPGYWADVQLAEDEGA